MDLIITSKSYALSSPYQNLGELVAKKTIFLIDWPIDTKNRLQVELTTFPNLIPTPNSQELETLASLYNQALERFEHDLQEREFHDLSSLLTHEALVKAKQSLPQHWHYPLELLFLKRLFQKRRPQFLGRLASGNSPRLCGLITNLHDLTHFEPQLFTTWKIKVGRLAFEQEWPMIEQLLRKYPSLKFRLDANENWGLKELQSVALAMEANQAMTTALDYLESPVSDHGVWNSFYKKYNIPLALDLAPKTNLRDLESWQGLKALVVKPSLLSLSTLSEAIAWSRERSINIILSSCFEGERGISDLMQLAALFNLTEDQGLGTLSYLDEIPT